jgi:hypothetical protein
MTIGLLTLHLLSIVAVGITVFYGIRIPHGGGAFGHHFLYALGAASLAVFTHTMTYFYFVGMGANLKRAVEEHGRGQDRLAESRRIKRRVFPWAFFGMGLLMATFILGGGAHTRVIPGWIHGGLGYLALAYTVVAFFVEGFYLLQQNGVVNEFQRELVATAAAEGSGS